MDNNEAAEEVPEQANAGDQTIEDVLTRIIYEHVRPFISDLTILSMMRGADIRRLLTERLEQMVQAGRIRRRSTCAYALSAAERRRFQ